MLDVIFNYVASHLSEAAYFVAGFWLGYRFDLFRDQRKEFLEISDTVTEILLRKRRGGKVPSVRINPSEVDLHRLAERARWWKRRSLERAISAYVEATDEKHHVRDTYLDVAYGNPEEVTAAINRLLRVVRRY